MMSKWRSLACGGALAGAVLMSMTAWSMGPQHGAGGDPSRMIAHMSERLDLSDEQKSEVDTLVTAARQSSEADRARMQELREQLSAMKSNFDPGKAQAVADEIGQLTGRMVYQATETFAKVYQVLDAEQRTQLDAMMKKRAEHGGRRGKGGNKPD